MTNETMKAWRLREFGLGNLRLEQTRRPVPAATDVLVRVRAVSLNYRDKLVVEGALLPERPEMPFIPVSDFCGEIAEIGRDVTRFAPGDGVMGNFWTEWIDGPPPRSMLNHGLSLGGPLPGALAEYIAVPESVAVAAPANLTAAEASTLPIAALTAWCALAETGNIREDQTVLVQGTGGVALAGLQIATALGARVIATSRSGKKLAQVSKLGAWAGIDTSAEPNWPKKVMELTDGAGVDHILELIGGDNLSRSLEAVAPQGQISLIGFLNGMDAHISAVPFMLRRVKLQGVSVGHRRALERLVQFIQEKDIHPFIDKDYAFESAHEAFAHLDRGPFGKIVVRIDG
jgi:NADPH:quinone reductase-like Zn-dependent oxidoreductase